MKKFLSGISLVVSCAVLIFSVNIQASEALSGAAPDFTLPSNLGKNLRLAEMRGEVVMINFWASWCGPCKQEMPILEELHQRYGKAGFKLLGVNVEPDPADAQKILKAIPVSFPILYDTESVVSKLYDVEAMPSTVIVDRNGNMRYLHKGYKPGYEEDYRKQIKELIRE
jgi:thiol-disulfide isomerase/thioredoxin